VIESLIKHQVPGITPKYWKLVEDHGLKIAGLYLVVLHACTSDADGLCVASNLELSQAVNESIRSIGYMLKKLEALEYIRVRRVNQYLRRIEAFETERMKRYLDKQKGIQAPDWLDGYMEDLAKMQG